MGAHAPTLLGRLNPIAEFAATIGNYAHPLGRVTFAVAETFATTSFEREPCMPIDFKQLYDAEITEWDRHRSTASMPVGIATIVGGGLAYMLQKFDYSENVCSILFVGVACVACIHFLQGALYLSRLMHGNGYKRMPLPIELHKYRNGLRAFHVGKQEAARLADSDFDSNIERRYAEAASFNAKVNIARSNWLYLVHSRLINASLFTILAIPLFAWNARSSDEKPQRVEIVGFPGGMLCRPDRHRFTEGIIINSSTPKAPQPSPDPEPAPSSSPPADRPDFPDFIDVQEGIVPIWEGLTDD